MQAVNQYEYDAIAVGMEEGFNVRVTEKMMEDFCRITEDINPLHADGEYARAMGYKDRVAYGMLTASFFSTIAGVYLPGKYSLIHSVQISFSKPVFIGDQLHVSATVSEKNDLFRVIGLKVKITREDGEKVCHGKMNIGVLK